MPDQGISIYQTVKKFKNGEFDLVSATKHELKEMALSQVVNLHNLSGIRDLRQIIGMTSAIKLGLDIFYENGIPNIKMVVTGDEEFVLIRRLGRQNGQHVVANSLSGCYIVDYNPLKEVFLLSLS